MRRESRQLGWARQVTERCPVGKDRQKGNKGGLAIYIRTGINYVLNLQEFEMEAVVIGVDLKNKVITKNTNIYNPAGQTPNDNDLNYICSKRIAIPTVGFNAKDTSWTQETAYYSCEETDLKLYAIIFKQPTLGANLFM
jgi:hypothetical protein